VHFTPTGCSWLNKVERFFRDLTENQLRRGVFHDIEELIMAVGNYIDKHNDNPKPFIVDDHNNLGTIFSTGKVTRGRKEFEHVVRLSPNSPQGHYNLGVLRMQQAKPSEP
jgi:hypothetical protein